MTPSYRIGRIASTGVVITVLAIAVGILVVGVGTLREIRSLARSTALANVYAELDGNLSDCMGLERAYRSQGSSALRERFVQETRNLRASLVRIEQTGHAADRELMAEVRLALGPYELAVGAMFDAVDVGNEDLIEHLDREQVGPAFITIHEIVSDAVDAQAAATVAATDNLDRRQTLILWLTAIATLVGMGALAGFVMILGRYERRLVQNAVDSQHQATHDALTGLPNRTLFTDRIGQALSAGRRSGDGLAVLLLDLDRFKEVNDMLGHRYGDDLLRAVADRLSGMLRESDTVARLTGDEFAVLLLGVDADSARELGERIVDELHETFVLDDVTVDIEISVGVAVAPEHGDSVETVMRNADLAMYSAKDAKTGIVMYDPATLVHQPSRLILLGELRRALERPGELLLHYQPKVGLHLRDLAGVEALVRWHHPERGMVSPAEFIPMAESTGLINKLTDHVLELALAQIREWLDGGLEIPVAVNLSPRCLLDTALLDRVRDLLVRHRVPARLLRLEVTETAVMANPALAMTTLTGLHELGIRLSIDDYGTGYSSMAYLRRLPVDELKVDRSFVLNMTTNDNDAILVRSAIDLGHNLGLSVVAEGVENAEHVTALCELGCDVAQGYHFARPMPPDGFVEWLATTEAADATASR